ncbi:replication-relaxation family protein [Nonomuraea sp. NPDC005650]|uniref:replication-relaxation family protein n=1 Tax=Nonomuraea sp. NPDC005650 TaxID=3157045 RepID=UPI0033A29393
MPAQPVPAGQPRLDRTALTALAARLTPRDYDILTHLHQHRVLTTHQLQRIFFGIPQATRKRLGTLYAFNAVTRFRPWAPYGAGSRPTHWLLGRAGAAVLAIRDGITVKEFGYNPDHPIAVSSHLAHQVGVNDFFSYLHHHARQPGTCAEVKAWWPERRCAQLWGDLARPDAYGRWAENGREIDFFLEHDTGSETLAKVAAKLHGYANLTEATGITTPVLLWLPSSTRETNLRRVLTATEVPVATAVQNEDGPAGPVWLPVGSEQPRLRLSALSDAWPQVATAREEQTDA